MKAGRRIGTVLGALLVLGLPTAGAAQVAWDSPMLMPPRVADGFGVFLADVEGGDLGVIGMWRAPGWNFGVRGGIAEAAGGDLGVFAGFDVNGTLTRANRDFPLDIDWIFGAGLGVADAVRLSAPFGLTVGHEFEGDGVFFTPFATPRVVLDAFFGDEGRDDDLDLELAVDLGLDVRFTREFLVRFAGTIGDRGGVAIGVVF